MAVRKVPMRRIRSQYKKVRIDRKWIIGGLVLLLLSFLIDIVPPIFLLLFCFANAMLLRIDRYINAPVDIELSTFSAVLMTTQYGLKWGIAAAILTKVAAIVYNKNIRVDHFFMIGGYVVAAFVANIVPSGVSLILTGVVVTIMTNIYTIFVSKFITMLSSYEIMLYGISNFIFNIVLFIGFSELFAMVMI